MKIKDYFRKPIKTFCDVQGVTTDVIVEVDYQPPEESGPVCNMCSMPCTVIQVDNSPWNAAGGQSCDVGCTGKSKCCEVSYRISPAGANTEQAEVLEVKNLQGVSVMDSMYMVELEELEDRLLAMAHEDRSRRQDAADFAERMRDETLATNQLQRGVRI